MHTSDLRFLLLVFLLRAFSRLNGTVSSSNELDCIMEQKALEIESKPLEEPIASPQKEPKNKARGPEHRNPNALLAEYLVHVESQKHGRLTQESAVQARHQLYSAAQNLAMYPIALRSGDHALTENIHLISNRRAATVVLFLPFFLR